MKNKYLIGDVARYLFLSRDTLRYYDKLGIVSPKKDEKNGYRFYDMEDIITLSYVMILKDVGISLEEIKHMIYNYSLREMRDRILNQEELINKKIEELLNIKTRIKNFSNWCITAEEKLNKFEIISAPNFLYTKVKGEIKNTKLVNTIERLNSNKNIKETVFSIFISREIIDSKEIEDEFFSSGASGIVEDNFLSEYSIIPRRRCLNTVIEIKGDYWDNELTKIKKYLRDNNLKLVDDILCRAIAFENKDGFPKDFYELWIPIA